jgi:uncharacterized membrane protein YjfL (UPF0719 family)
MSHLEASGILSLTTLAAWGFWWGALSPWRPKSRRHATRLALLAFPAACLIIGAVLSTLSASDVRSNPGYLTLYGITGLLWVGLSLHLAPLIIGVRARLDVGERNNGAGALALVGMSTGCALAYAGANIGEGPGFPVVLACATLATAAQLLGLAIVNLAGELHESLAVERDTAAGARTLGLSVALGLIVGRAVAGAYEDVGGMLHDFVHGSLPALVLVAAEIVFLRWLRPTPREPRVDVVRAGWMPAMAHVGFAIAVLMHEGRP